MLFLHLVVLGVDLTVKYNDYLKAMCASTSSKTIFINNPATKEAFNLHNYAKQILLPPILPLFDQLSKLKI